MALKMPGPTVRPSGVFQLNVRVPADLMTVVPGTRFTLPVGSGTATVTASDKVMLSLRTKDQREARARYIIAQAAHLAHFEGLRSNPAAPVPKVAAPVVAGAVGSVPSCGTKLTHKQVVALAGDVYREFFDEHEDEFDLKSLASADELHETSVRAWMVGDEDDGVELPREQAEALAKLQQPFGPQLLAWERGGDVISPYLCEPMLYEHALEGLFGRHANRVCAKHRLQLHPESRIELLKQIGNTCALGGERLQRLIKGDYSPDPNLARFPTFDVATKVSVALLFERWRESNKSRVEASTIRRYTPSVNSLARFVGDKDVRRVTQDHIWNWTDHRRDKDGIGASTINRNDLVAASAVFSFATTRDGKRLRPDNPVDGVKLIVVNRRSKLDLAQSR